MQTNIPNEIILTLTQQTQSNGVSGWNEKVEFPMDLFFFKKKKFFGNRYLKSSNAFAILKILRHVQLSNHKTFLMRFFFFFFTTFRWRLKKNLKFDVEILFKLQTITLKDFCTKKTPLRQSCAMKKLLFLLCSVCSVLSQVKRTKKWKKKKWKNGTMKDETK